MINREAEQGKATEDFNLKEEIKKLEESPRRDLNIIGFYLSERSVDIRNKEQLNVAIRRHLRPAGLLSPFDDDQIVRGFNLAKEQTEEWVLETVLKQLVK